MNGDHAEMAAYRRTFNAAEPTRFDDHKMEMTVNMRVILRGAA